MDLASIIRNVPDFPQPGIQFKDITSLLECPDAFRYVIDTFHDRYRNQSIDVIVAADARGFIFGAALAYLMEVPLVPVRKFGKLPGKTLKEEFELEYGMATFEIHADAIGRGDRAVLIDDLLATGGTMNAMARLVERLGAEIVEMAFVVELPPLNGRRRLSEYFVHSLVSFDVA